MQLTTTMLINDNISFHTAKSKIERIAKGQGIQVFFSTICGSTLSKAKQGKAKLYLKVSLIYLRRKSTFL